MVRKRGTDHVEVARPVCCYPGFYGVSTNDITTESYAVFGELTWNITEKLDLTGGMRVSYDKSSIDFSRPDVYLNGYGFAFQNEDSFVGYQPKIAVGYEVVTGTRVYGLISRGYKPGGFNHTISSLADAEPYDPETAWNYEAGIRSSLFDNRLEVSAAVYHIAATDKQIYVGPIGYQVLRNMGEAESTGIELEARWRVTDQLTLSANAAFGRSEFTDYVDPYTLVDYTGNILPYAPEQTANALARYTFDKPLLGGRVAVQAGVNYIGSFYFNEANTLDQPAYVTFDAAAEIAWSNGVALKLFIDNIADETYQTYSYESAGNVFSNVGEGRTIGLTVRGTF